MEREQLQWCELALPSAQTWRSLLILLLLGLIGDVEVSVVRVEQAAAESCV
jgi:hypothetical protein